MNIKKTLIPLMIMLIIISGCSKLRENTGYEYLDIYGEVFNSEGILVEEGYIEKNNQKYDINKGTFKIDKIKIGERKIKVVTPNYKSFYKKIKISQNKKIDIHIDKDFYLGTTKQLIGKISNYNYSNAAHQNFLEETFASANYKLSENEVVQSNVITDKVELLFKTKNNFIKDDYNLEFKNIKENIYSIKLKVEIAENLKKELLKQDDTIFVEINSLATLSNFGNSNSDYFGLITSNVLPAWDNFESQREVSVAVLDTGVVKHPDLINNLNLELGYDFINDKDEPLELLNETSSHGTHVSGIIGANGNMIGVNPEAEIIPIKVLNVDGVGTLQTILEGLKHSQNIGVDVVNLSLNFDYIGDYAKELLENKINDLYNDNIVIVASSGNQGYNKIGYPAKFENVISVGAVNYELNEADYSNTGSNLDILAPGGCSQLSIFSTGVLNGEFDYIGLRGTSMAAGYVSGLASILKSQNIESAQKIKETIIGFSNSNYENPVGLLDVYGSLIEQNISEFKVFAGIINKDNNIEIVSDIYNVIEDFKLYNILEEEVYIMAWRDITKSGTIESGDYFGKRKINFNEEYSEPYIVQSLYIHSDFSENIEVINKK